MSIKVNQKFMIATLGIVFLFSSIPVNASDFCLFVMEMDPEATEPPSNMPLDADTSGQLKDLDNQSEFISPETFAWKLETNTTAIPIKDEHSEPSLTMSAPIPVRGLYISSNQAFSSSSSNSYGSMPRNPLQEERQKRLQNMLSGR